MKSAIRLTFMSLIMTFFCDNSFSQKAPMKFGKIDMKNLEMKVYEKDTSAAAVVLMDFGKSYFRYSKEYGFQVVFEHQKRIKILNKNGYDQADVEIDLYHSGSDKEKLTGLKGVVYNLEKGKIVKNKLNNKSIFEEKSNYYLDMTKFTMPNVKVGSIIEYSYSITSDFTFNYREWEFQEDIPVVWSEYIASFPEYYTYQKVSQGYLPFTVNSTDQKMKSFNVVTNTKSERTKSISTKSAMVQNEIKYRETTNRWVVENAPAFVEESFMTTYSDYITKIKFELSYTQFPNRPINNVMGDWATLNKKFLENEFFGQKVKASGFLKKQVETIITGLNSDPEKVAAIYNSVKSNVKWNGENRKYLETNFRKPLDSHEGSSAEINLLLTSMLQKSGLKADPVLISTRSHGMVRKQYSVADQFNYVICKVVIEGKTLLLDATDSYTPLGMLPMRCLNGQGWVVSETGSGWIDLNPSAKQSEKTVGKLTFTENGGLVGDVEYRHSGYSARSPRKSYLTKGEKDYSDDIISNSDWDITSLEIENGKDLSKPFVKKYEVELDAEVEKLGNQTYFNPLLGSGMDENPFKLEERKYPIDFASPIEEVVYITYTLPEGYHVEEKPVPVAFALPNKAAMYSYNINVQGNQMTVMSKLNVNKTLFVPAEYANVKEFFAQVVAKQSEQVVLKQD